VQLKPDNKNYVIDSITADIVTINTISSIFPDNPDSIILR